MPALDLWAVQQTELEMSASAQRPRAGIFRHIQSITCLLHISTQKIAEKFCWIKTTSKHCEKKMSTYWHQKTINGDRRCCLWCLCSGCSDLLAPPSSFIRIWHDTMLLTLGFDISKSFESCCQKPLACNVMTTPTSVVRTKSMFTQNVYCGVRNFAPFELYWTKERYIKFSLKLRIFHLKIVKECIVIYNQQCFMVDMRCRGDR